MNSENNRAAVSGADSARCGEGTRHPRNAALGTSPSAKPRNTGWDDHGNGDGSGAARALSADEAARQLRAMEIEDELLDRASRGPVMPDPDPATRDIDTGDDRIDDDATALTLGTDPAVCMAAALIGAAALLGALLIPLAVALIGNDG